MRKAPTEVERAACNDPRLDAARLLGGRGQRGGSRCECPLTEEDLVGTWSGSIPRGDFETGEFVEDTGLVVTFDADGSWESNYREITTDSVAKPQFYFEGRWRLAGDRILALTVQNKSGGWPYTYNFLHVSRSGGGLVLNPQASWGEAWHLEERRP